MDNLSIKDKKVLIDSLLYKDYISSNEMIEIINLVYPVNQDDNLKELLNSAILYRHREIGNKFNTIIENYAPFVKPSDAKKIINDTLDNKIFTTKFDTQVNEILKLNSALKLESELKNQTANNQSSRFKI